MRVSASTLLALLVLVACDSVDPCDPESVAEQLAAAVPGDVIRIGVCTLPAGLTVPPGVTLEGVGSSQSAIEALPGNLVAIGVDTAPGLVTVVRGLGVVSQGAGLAVRGEGQVVIEDVSIDVETGTGVDVDGALAAELRQVQVRGPISADNANDVRWIEPGANPGLIGIAFHDVGMATLSDVQVDGMAWGGLVAENSELQVERMSVRNTLGYGVVLLGGTSDFRALEITDTHQGLRGEPSIALATRDATWSADGFVLLRSDRYGIVSQAGSIAIDDLDAQTGGDAALWIGNATAVRLGGENTIDDMRFAGAVLVDSQAVDIRNLTISNIGLATRNIGAGGLFAMLELGDGVHLIGDLEGATFDSVAIRGAERVGVLLELGDGSAPTFTAVQVDAPSSALGAVAGRSSGMPFELDVNPEPAWDEGITRDAASETGDAMFSGSLGVARAASPAPLPL